MEIEIKCVLKDLARWENTIYRTGGGSATRASKLELVSVELTTTEHCFFPVEGGTLLTGLAHFFFILYTHSFPRDWSSHGQINLDSRIDQLIQLFWSLNNIMTPLSSTEETNLGILVDGEQRAKTRTRWTFKCQVITNGDGFFCGEACRIGMDASAPNPSGTRSSQLKFESS